MNIRFLKSLGVIFIGGSLMTFATANFSMQHYLADSGFTGIKVIVYRVFGMNPGLVGYLINVPLLLIFYRFYDKRTFLMTIYGMGVFNATLWFFVEIGSIVPYMGNMLPLVAIFHGLFTGIGIGLVASVNGTTGGSFIVGMLAERYTKLTIGQAMSLFDTVVILLSMFVFLTLINALYTLVAIFVHLFVIAWTRKVIASFHLPDNANPRAEGLFAEKVNNKLL